MLRSTRSSHAKNRTRHNENPTEKKRNVSRVNYWIRYKIQPSLSLPTGLKFEGHWNHGQNFGVYWNLVSCLFTNRRKSKVLIGSERFCLQHAKWLKDPARRTDFVSNSFILLINRYGLQKGQKKNPWALSLNHFRRLILFFAHHRRQLESVGWTLSSYHWDAQLCWWDLWVLTQQKKQELTMSTCRESARLKMGINGRRLITRSISMNMVSLIFHLNSSNILNMLKKLSLKRFNFHYRT